MDHRRAVQFIGNLMLHLIDHLMKLHQTSIHRNLRMQGKHGTSRPVIVNHQIMHPQNFLPRKNNFMNPLHKAFLRRLSKQRIDGIPCCRNTGIHDKDSHQHTAHTINLKSRKMGYHRRNQYNKGCYRITDTIQSRCSHGSTGNLFAIRAVICKHIQLDKNRNYQHYKRTRMPDDLLRVQDLLPGASHKLHRHNHNDHRYDQACYILQSAMTKGMLRIRLLTCQTESKQKDQGRTGIRQVIKGICHNCNRMTEPPHKKLPGKQ